MRSIENKLKSILFRSDCPSNMDLGEYELGILEPPKRDEIAVHLVACAHCQADLQQIRQFMALPAIGVEARLAEAAERVPLLERIKVIIVNLTSPPENVLGMGSLQPVFRGTETDKTQVVEADEYLISLTTVAEKGSNPKQQLIGNIIPLLDDTEQFENWTVDLWRTGELLATSAVGSDSYFVFDTVQIEDRAHELILSGPAVEIHLQNLHIS